VRAVRAETSGERGGWGGWAGRGRRLTRARSDAGSAEAARSTAPAACAGRGRAGRSKLKRMSNPRSMSRAVGTPRQLSTYAARRCRITPRVKSKKLKVKVRDHGAGRVGDVLRTIFAYFIRRPRPSLHGWCPQQIRGFPAGTPSVHAAAPTLSLKPHHLCPVPANDAQPDAQCYMLTRIPRQRSLSERITQLLGTVPYLSAEASPLHERQHMRRRRSRIRALPPHPDVSSRDRVFHSADGARAQSKSNFADFVQSVQLCGFRAWGYLTPRSAAPEEPNG
jgi:hypothetical protein